MYDTATSGFEVYWFYPNNDTLSPIGRMQAAAKNWTNQYGPTAGSTGGGSSTTAPAPASTSASASASAGRAGVHIATCALLVDFYAGWETPCSDPGWPFSSAWGQRSYSPADYLTDGIFDLAYPGYRNAGYYKDASYELSPTPFGDVFDVLLTDTSAALLTRYDTVIVSHSLASNKRLIAQRLQAFVEQGGHIVLTWDALADLELRGGADSSRKGGSGGGSKGGTQSASSLFGGLHVLRQSQKCKRFDGNTLAVSFLSSERPSEAVHADDTFVEPHPVLVCEMNTTGVAQGTMTTVATAIHTGSRNTKPMPLVVRVSIGSDSNGGSGGSTGSITLVGIGNYGVTDMLIASTPKACQVDTPTLSPQPIAGTVARVVSNAMAEQALFDLSGPGTAGSTNLSWVAKAVAADEYLLGVSNTQLTEQPLHVRAKFGTILSVEEVPLDQAEKSEPGYLPHGFEGVDTGRSTNTTIAGADFRVLRLKVMVDGAGAGAGAAAGSQLNTRGGSVRIRPIPHTIPPRAPTGVWMRLPLASAMSAPSGATGGYEYGRQQSALRGAILRRPCFRQLFDGVLVDWSYLHVRTNTTLAADAAWLRSQRLNISVDLSSGINLFPGLRLGNFTGPSDPFFNRSLVTVRDVMQKTSMMGGRRLLLSLHGMPELGPDSATVKATVASTVTMLAREAAALSPPLSIHLRQTAKNGAVAGSQTASQFAWAEKLQAQLEVHSIGGSVQFAPNTGIAAVEGVSAAAMTNYLAPSSMLLINGASHLYATNRHGTENAPLTAAGSDTAAVLTKVVSYVQAAIQAKATVILDPTFADIEQEEDDLLWLEGLVASGTPSPSPSLPTPTPPTPLAPTPPPPTPPSPAPAPTPPTPASQCYKLGTPMAGLCEVHGRVTNQYVVMGCAPSTGSCYADYLLPSGKWAGAYGDHFGNLVTLANAAECTTALSVHEGRWTITVQIPADAHAADTTTRTWSSDPTGYIHPNEVIQVRCGDPTRMNRTFSCVAV
jgi:hypothetical protein